MINLKTKSIVYILCPSNHFTGGPLALHQLGFMLQKNGFIAVMYYTPISTNPINEQFKKYNLPYTFNIEDSNNNVIIIPEVMTDIAAKYHQIRKVIWWLSIDNYFKGSLKERIHRFLGIIKRFNFRNADKYTHFAQSEYAYQYLLRKSKISQNNLFKISDYLLEDFLDFDQSDFTNKKDIVLYNPKKGYRFTKKIIERSNNRFKWMAIENMTPSQVKEALLQSKIYIDFGKHPGKDRFPREAVICGCCLITGLEGSARYNEDIPIPDEYKFKNNKRDINAIISKIETIMNDFENEFTKFKEYVVEIKKQPDIFEKEIMKVFKLYQE